MAETPLKAESAVQQTTVTLETPIRRGNTTVKEVHVRKPVAGAFRGVALVDVLQMEAQALQKVLPRITDPALQEQEIRNLDPADMFQFGEVLAGYVTPKKYKAAED
ncbi:MAG: phage tail assembly protein [Pseudohongiellaceae bacterium]